MMLYGDPGEQVSLRASLHALEERARGLSVENELDAARALLIQTGQVEQGLVDIDPDRKTLSLTDAAAAAFLDAWEGLPPQTGPLLDQMRELGEWREESLFLKVPEGFAFYTLYPEQYALAAMRWAKQMEAAGAPRSALVVGIRSIGTTLSAAVAATLQRRGWLVERATLRPTGHPYQRQATLPRTPRPDVHHVLIVDEGPGRSGSSFVAVAEALLATGFSHDRIHFFPGHGGMPGEEASDEVRRWWQTTPRHVARLEDVRWRGRSLVDVLSGATAEVLCVPAGQLTMQDLSGGGWQKLTDVATRAWPAFERTKYRMVAPDGRAILWKFAGLTHAEAAVATLRARADWTAPCIGQVLGFVGTHWIVGRPLVPEDLDERTLGHMANYLLATAGSELSEQEAAAAVERLQEMARTNLHESLGPEEADRFFNHTMRLRTQLLHERRRSRDGRLAPWEWIRTPDGRLVKTDAQTHTPDHTCIGDQSLLWDVASLVCDGNLSPAAQDELLDAMGLGHLAEVTTWYSVAFAAFRLALTTFSQQDPADDLAKLRALTRRLAQQPPAKTS